jgi:hypothetical protein
MNQRCRSLVFTIGGEVAVTSGRRGRRRSWGGGGAGAGFCGGGRDFVLVWLDSWVKSWAGVVFALV